MTVSDRDRLIECLENLGSTDDEQALAAAREAASIVDGLGTSWDDLVVAEDDDSTLATEEEAETPATPVASKGYKEELAMIEALLSRANLFEGTRQELLGYKEDIAAGEFHRDDSRYLKALQKRLQKKR